MKDRQPYEYPGSLYYVPPISNHLWSTATQLCDTPRYVLSPTTRRSIFNFNGHLSALSFTSEESCSIQIHIGSLGTWGGSILARSKNTLWRVHLHGMNVGLGVEVK